MTPEATDLVARLRKEASKAGMMLSDPPQPSPVMAVCDEAATLIEAQAAEIEEARRLLTIFDKHLGEDDGMWTDGSAVQSEWIGEGGVRHSLTFGLFRQVRAFLASRTERSDA